MKSRKLILLIVIVAAIGAFFALDLGRYFNLEFIKSQQAAIAGYRDTHVLLSAAIFFLAYVAITALSLPGAAIMTLLGGAVFGLWQGTLLSVSAATVGATLAFLSARFLFRDAVRQRFAARLTAIDEGVRREGALYLLILRLVPAFPFFLVNLVMGLTPIRVTTYMLISLLAMLPGSFVYTNAGTQLARIDSLHGILSPGLIGAFVLLGIFPLIAKKTVEYIKSRRASRDMRKPRRYDRNLIVIGAGSAGLVASYIAAAVKAKVTLIEKHRMGGDCLNTGCVPSKALVRSTRLIALMRRGREFGLPEINPNVNFRDVMTRVRGVIETVAPHDSIERYTSLGVECIRGSARLVSPWAVEVNGRTLTARAIVLATGASPTVPPIPGLRENGYLTSDTLWNLDHLPNRLLVLGGGPIGCELAQCFARLGSKVAIIEMSERLLPREDPDASERVADRLRRDGVRLRLGHKALRVERQGVDLKYLVCESQGEVQAFEFDQILVAVGRSANVKGYGLEELGVEVDRTIKTNAFLQTNFPSIYACGDVAGPYQFTHTAGHQAWYAAVNGLFSPFKKFKVDYSVIPWATFTDPEVARVGLNETDARAQNVPHEVTRYDLADLDRAIAEGEAHGYVKVLTVPGKDRILGCTIVGEQAAELLAEFVLAMRHGIGLNKLLSTIHIYPTLMEANKMAAGAWKKAHAPQRALHYLKRFHAWRRGR